VSGESPPPGAGEFPDPEDLPSGEAKRRAVRSMFDSIAPRYDLVNRVMTFRLDVRWRRKAIESLDLPPGSMIADLAAGTGDLCRELNRQGHAAIGFDLSMGMLRAARTASPLVHADVLALPIPDGSVDGATCGFALRNLVDLNRFFEELARVVRPAGRIALLEVAEPRLRLLKWGHEVYFGRIVPRIGALLSDGAAYRYLPRSVAYLPGPAQLIDSLAGAGFTSVERRLLSSGIAQLLTATRADRSSARP
jgi:demethylmenaquinone methyltransferase/2-methoxy-6-polyprenyl-1,4-benzoquinol methylase